YWITYVMLVYGDFDKWAGPRTAFALAALLNVALVAYLALFPAVFAVIVRRLIAVHGTIALTTAPLVWVATELGRTYLFTGFPWVLLGYSQVAVLPVAQLASVFGVYGVSALVCAVSAAAVAIVYPHRASAPAALGRGRLRPMQSFALAVVLLLVGNAIWGS